MKLYFENSRERRLIGEPKTDKECWSIINDFCAERNYQIPYVRSWKTEDGEMWYDLGSWNEFFVVIDD